MVVLNGAGLAGSWAVFQWRVSKLDEWRGDVDEYLDDAREKRGEVTSTLKDHERRLDVLENHSYERRPR